MTISVFGLGYVGAVTAACLSEKGHSVIGVDVHRQKVEEFNRGRAPIIEPELDELVGQAHARGMLRATMSCAEALAGSQASLVCVGTPSRLSGGLDLSHVRQVSGQIGEVLRGQERRHVLIFRSTMLPGSTRGLVRDFFGEPVGTGQLEVIYHPEFLREGTAVADFREPALAVVGTEKGASFSEELWGLLGEGSTVVSWETAELVKYACNAFHATKVTFANEIGRLGKEVGIDAEMVMELLCRDGRLNLSSYYLRPGNPFGGSCLPKDVRALSDFGRRQGLSLPLLESLLLSNQQHLRSLLDLVARRGQREVVILGLAFKPRTDDLRESAMLEVARNLVGHGYDVRIYDPQLKLARIVGGNKRVIEVQMPQLASLLKESVAEAVGRRGLVLAAQRCADLAELARCITAEHHLVDINGWPELRGLPAKYEGFCW